MVDQGRGVDDQVDGVGQPLPGLRVQAEVGLALVAGDDFEVVGGQLLVVRQQLRVAAVERLVQAGRASSSDFARTSAITLPSTRSIRSSHSSAR